MARSLRLPPEPQCVRPVVERFVKPIVRSIDERCAGLPVERGDAGPAERLLRRDEGDLVGKAKRNQPPCNLRSAFAEDTRDPPRRKRARVGA